MRLIVDLSPSNPAVGLAEDEALLESVREGAREAVRLWVNDRALIVGRAQAVASEVDLDAAFARGIPVLRRISGGGTVYHYPGNLNVSIVLRGAVGDVSEVFARWGGAIRRGLATLPLPVDVRGNRLLFQGRKLGGAAQVRRAPALLYHSTVLVRPPSFPIEDLLLAHRPNYRTDGVPSRPEPTVTLSEAIGRTIDLGTAADAVRSGMATGCALESDGLSALERQRARVLAETKYGRAEWNASR